MNISEKKIHDFQERHAWVEWAVTPHKEREGRDNVLPEIVEYINGMTENYSKLRTKKA